LGLSKSFASNALLLKVGYVVIVAVTFVIVGARSWNAWRRRRTKQGHLVIAEAAEVAKARRDWRQRDNGAEKFDPIHVKELALVMWRTRAIDSRKVAAIKDILSVVAAIAFGIALAVSAYLVWHARFTS
jgi:hypothetical protein